MMSLPLTKASLDSMRGFVFKRSSSACSRALRGVLDIALYSVSEFLQEKERLNDSGAHENDVSKRRAAVLKTPVLPGAPRGPGHCSVEEQGAEPH